MAHRSRTSSISGTGRSPEELRDPPPRDVRAVEPHDRADLPRADAHQSRHVAVGHDPPARHLFHGPQHPFHDHVVHGPSLPDAPSSLGRRALVRPPGPGAPSPQRRTEGEPMATDGQPHRPARRRRRPLRLLRGRMRPRARHPHDRRRVADELLAQADAGRHAPEVGRRLAPRRRRRAHLRGVLRGPRARARRPRPRADRGLPRPHRLVRRAEGARRRRAPRRHPGPPTATASSRRWPTARRSRPRRCWPRPASGTSSTSRWHEGVPEHRRAHTCDLVDFDDLAGARVVVVGGRQSAYEWAALLCDHGAASVDVVHRHPTPAFERVSWAFVDPYVEQTLGAARLVARRCRRRSSSDRPGVLAGRPAHARALAGAAAAPDVVTSHPGCAVVDVEGGDEGRCSPSPTGPG